MQRTPLYPSRDRSPTGRSVRVPAPTGISSASGSDTSFSEVELVPIPPLSVLPTTLARTVGGSYAGSPLINEVRVCEQDKTPMRARVVSCTRPTQPPSLCCLMMLSSILQCHCSISRAAVACVLPTRSNHTTTGAGHNFKIALIFSPLDHSSLLITLDVRSRVGTSGPVGLPDDGCDEKGGVDALARPSARVETGRRRMVRALQTLPISSFSVSASAL